MTPGNDDYGIVMATKTGSVIMKTSEKIREEKRRDGNAFWLARNMKHKAGQSGLLCPVASQMTTTTAIAANATVAVYLMSAIGGQCKVARWWRTL